MTLRSCFGILRLGLFWLIIIAAASLILALLPRSLNGATPMPPKERAERLTFDEETQTWVRAPTPIPGTEDGDLDIARQMLARGQYKKARKAVKKWMKQYPTSPRYAEALYVRGTAYLESGDYAAAHKDYQQLLDEFPGSDYAERALSAEFRIAEQYLAGKRRKIWGGVLRLRNYDGGLEIMDDLSINYADTPYAELAQLAKAEYYYASGEFELAEDAYAQFARDFPRSRYHPKALLQSARAALASFPGVHFDDAGLIEAQERFSQFTKLYPGLAQQLDVPVIQDQIAATRADKTYHIARFYDKTGHQGAAAFYYRAAVTNWPDTPAAAQAQGRLIILDAVLPPVDVEQIDGVNEESPTQGGE
ncbi:MAG: outer membrane protein assembly factor BamD [Planctomycetota bacterium]|nr:MAG: outer membrane protein assembly factor BamD [Planctomycetota bacterium]